MAERLLASGELQWALIALGVALQAYSNRRDAWPLDHETLSHRDGRRDSRNLRITADHGEEVGLRLPRRVGQDLADKTIKTQADVGDGFLCGLDVGEPTKAKVCVLHGESFFSWVRIWVSPLAKASVSSWENRSRSCRILVPSSSCSSQWSVNLTERQCAM